MNVRLSAIISKLIYHIHDVVEEFNVSEDELLKAIDFLTEVGKNGEYHLLSDVLGVSVNVNNLTHGLHESNSTAHNVEGPLYREGAPLVDHEASLYEGDEKGNILVVSGQVRTSDNKPVTNAIVDVWQADHKGDYENQDPNQADYNFRRKIKTDENGYYKLKTVIPGPYRISKDGAVGKMLKAIGRHDWRPAHIHFKVEGEGYEPLTTMVFIENDPWIDNDAIGAVKDSLILKVNECNDSDKIEDVGLEAPFFEAEYDFVLTSTKAPITQR